jgi:hypothetical protein
MSDSARTEELAPQITTTIIDNFLIRDSFQIEGFRQLRGHRREWMVGVGERSTQGVNNKGVDELQGVASYKVCAGNLV